jgi:hypothetical protein
MFRHSRSRSSLCRFCSMPSYAKRIHSGDMCCGPSATIVVSSNIAGTLLEDCCSERLAGSPVILNAFENWSQNAWIRLAASVLRHTAVGGAFDQHSEIEFGAHGCEHLGRMEEPRDGRAAEVSAVIITEPDAKYTSERQWAGAATRVQEIRILQSGSPLTVALGSRALAGRAERIRPTTIASAPHSPDSPARQHVKIEGQNGQSWACR